MISANEFRKGATFEMDGHVYEIVDFQHVKPGKGAAFVRTKIRDVMSGSTRDHTFNPSDRYPLARIENKAMQYLYADGDLHYFMDTETYEQLPLESDLFGDARLYIKENDNANIKFYQGKAFSVEAPNFVELAVIETEPGIRGDTASGATKPATVETGAVLQVPLFVEIGDVIKIDTRTDEYLSRI